jgi:hypothetical protein
MAKSLTQHMQKRNAMQLKNGGPGDPPKSKKAGDPPKGGRSFTMVPTDDRQFVQGTGRMKNRIFSATPVGGKVKKVMIENMRQEYKEGVRTKENYTKGRDSLRTQGQALDLEKYQKSRDRKATIDKIKKKLPKGGKGGMWGPMSACGQKGCK